MRPLTRVARPLTLPSNAQRNTASICLPFKRVMSSQASRSKRSFAPIGQNANSTNSNAPALQGIVFDMDGTLVLPQNYMFAEMRSALGISKSVDILDHVHSLPPTEQKDAFSKIEAIERTAMAEQTPQPGLTTLLEFLDRHGVRKAICTRNFDAPVKHFNQNHVPGSVKAFGPIVTRSFKPPKPAPDGIWSIARSWGVEVKGDGGELPLIMVGDSEDDMAAGRSAGCVTVLLRSEGKEELEEDERTDLVMGRLDELVGLLEGGLSVG